MKNILLFLLILIIQSISFSQDTDLYSPANRRMFANYLYCQKDYLRAAEEYKYLFNSSDDDTLRYKVGLAYIKIAGYDSASANFLQIKNNSPYYNSSRLEYYKAQFLLNNYDVLEGGSTEFIPVQKLNEFTFLLGNKTLPADKEKFLNPFEGAERKIVSEFYDRKLNPGYKSELAAVIFSILVPGTGKIYTNNYGDGVISFLVTSILSYIAYTDFKADHIFRGWLFTGLAAFFRAGDIYGSIASTQIYNARINFSLNSDMKIFLENKNYFVPDDDFCK